MFCSNCGKEIDNEAIVCPNCGVLTEKGKLLNGSNQNVEKVGNDGIVSIVLGAIGIVGAWIIALLGYVLGGIGLVYGIRSIIKGDKVKGIIGATLSVLTIVFSIINSILGLLILSGLY